MEKLNIKIGKQERALNGQLLNEKMQTFREKREKVFQFPCNAKLGVNIYHSQKGESNPSVYQRMKG